MKELIAMKQEIITTSLYIKKLFSIEGNETTYRELSHYLNKLKPDVRG